MAVKRAGAAAMTAGLRLHAPRLTAIVVILAAAALARPPAYSSSERAQLASRFAFRDLPLRSASTAPQRAIRNVQPQLRRISAWISSVGAAVALADIDRDGLPNDVCLVDPRTDSVTVAPAPSTGRRFSPFLLEPTALRYDRATMAPMGCLPGDFDENGRPDLLVYYWGRTPVLFLRRAGGRLSSAAFEERELVAGSERWFTDAVTSADVDNDGHLDLVVGNYFPDEARVLDARATSDPRMQMQSSMSRAVNAGTNRILLSAGGGVGARFVEAPGAMSSEVARAWTLAIGAADLNDDLKPELYFANDFGPDRLLVNRSTPGRVRLSEVRGRRGFGTPASKALGHDSFKGMGMDFGDLDGDGLADIVVSNIAAKFALQESNLAFINTGGGLAAGKPAPFVDRGERLGLARSGWSWDVKLGDFDNDSTPEVVQATGFISGKTNRWPELQELATSNDAVLRSPWAWPRLQLGDDLSGHEPNAFYVRAPDGRFVDVATRVDVGDMRVTRGIAMADVDGDGRLDFATAGQWAPSHLYVNRAQRTGAFLGLDLRLTSRPGRQAAQARAYPSRDPLTRPAIGAQARVLLPDGRALSGEVDGGNGHASVRAPSLLFGLGRRPPKQCRVELRWRTAAGTVRHAALALSPGWHTVLLTDR